MIENINKLNTKEDYYFIHKILGFICLSNYVYRYYLLFIYGNMFLESRSSIILILLHGVLSCSSLIFHIPNNRNIKSPMIYPEYRLHSIIFALRSVLCCCICYINLHFTYKIAICYTTMIFADIITFFYKIINNINNNINKNTNTNTNNGSTMRNMPFDTRILLEEQKNITHMNSSMQIGATIYMLGTIDTAFSPMFGIQFAALLMTLVRKNIISANSWYIYYGFSLWINIYFFICSSMSIDFLVAEIVMYSFYTKIVFIHRINKYIGWTFLFVLFYIKQEYYVDVIALFIEKNNLINIEYYFRYCLVIKYLYTNLYKSKALFLSNKNKTS